MTCNLVSKRAVRSQVRLALREHVINLTEINECCKERECVKTCQAIVIDSKENTRMENSRSRFDKIH